MKKLPEVFVTFPAVFGNTKECEERKENMKEEKAEAKERKNTESGLSCCCHVVLTEYPMRLFF